MTETWAIKAILFIYRHNYTEHNSVTQNITLSLLRNNSRAYFIEMSDRVKTDIPYIIRDVA